MPLNQFLTSKLTNNAEATGIMADWCKEIKLNLI